MSPYTRRPFIIIGIAILLLCIGTVGYILIEGWSLLDAFYMTVITVSTVGFAEIHPLSDKGRLFTSMLVIASVFLIAYGVEFIVSARLGGQFFRRRQMMRQVRKMNDHVIICGFGRVGHSAAVALLESGRDIVAIERTITDVGDGLDDKIAFIEGDATKDDVLKQAGIERAWGTVICTGEDSINLFIVLSARTLNKDLFIVVRSDQANEEKMRRAGANRVVSPYQIGGRHMANIVIRPHVTDFFDVVTLDGGLELWLEELVIAPGSALAGQTVGAANVRRQTGVTLVAISNNQSETTKMPDANTLLEAGDELIVLGTRQQLAKLQKLARSI